MVDSGLALRDYLDHHAASNALTADVHATIEILAAVSADLSDIIALGALSGQHATEYGTNAGGDTQKALDVRANDMFRDALRAAPIAVFASEESDEIEILDPAGSLCLAIDPIDGSGNIDLNTPVGTIFSILPQPRDDIGSTASGAGFAWPAGTAQCAAGFVVYGPQTMLVLALGGRVDAFTLDRRAGTFRLTGENLRIPAQPSGDYAINASNYRHWEEPVRTYIDECLAGTSGPLGREFNMRWHGALVADAYRILCRGGLYLYPADARPGYGEGRLRLIYEAYPMALVMEYAGGAASDGRRRILDLVPQALHQRVPLIVGSKPAVEHLDARHHRPGIWPTASAPLFANRGLFRS